MPAFGFRVEGVKAEYKKQVFRVCVLCGLGFSFFIVWRFKGF